jgi:HK97 family phage prohead protease
MKLTFSSHIEAADTERRIIAGKIVPFEEVGNTSVGKVVFAKGSIEIGDPGKVKMLMQHRPEKPIGRMQSSYKEAEDGIYASFKISNSMQGQDALILASEQLIDGLSVGVDPNKSIQKKDYLYVTSATLREVSLVESPAFTAAQVTKVAASESEAETPIETKESEAPVEELATAPQEAKAEAATPTVGGTGVAPTVTVEAEGGAVSNTDMVSQYLSGTVSKYSGMNTLSVELLERSGYPGFYEELTNQLSLAYLKTIDTTVLTALLAAGMNGTNTTADLDGIVAFTTEGARTIYSNTGYFAQNYIANPAQWGALIGAQDTTKRPVFNALQPMNAAGQVGPQSIRGSVLGLDLYVDKNFSATTFDDDSAVILAPEAFTVYRSPQAYMSVNVVSNLQVQVAIYGYMATIAKMPNGIIKYKKT